MKLRSLMWMVLIAPACSQDMDDDSWQSSLSEERVFTRAYTKAPGKLRYLFERDGVDVVGSSHRYGFVDFLTTAEKRDDAVARRSIYIDGTERLQTRGPRALADYYDPAEVSAFLDQVQAAHPDIAMKVTLEDQLFEGQVIYAMKISDNVTVDEDEPTYMMDGQIHAREVMTVEVMVDAIDYLTSRYGSDARVDRWVDEMEIWIVPIVNPDGAAHMHTADSWWRKNRHPNCPVDNNRNFAWSWNACDGSSDFCSAEDYRGEAPLSEPETQAIRSLLLQVRPMYYINYHTFGEYIVWPGSCGLVEEEELLSLVGSELNDRVETDDGQTGNWTIGNSAVVLYPADGAADDEGYGAAGAVSFTFELNNTHQADYATMRDATVQRQREAWGYLLDRTLDGPSVTGHTYDSNTLAPVVATYMYANHPFESGQDPLVTDTQGQFGRAVLPDSDHLMVFTASGYLPETRQVHVDQGPVDLDVPMVAGVNHAPTADAGPDQIVDEGDTVHLNATGSSDPDGNTLFFQWNQQSGPALFLQDRTSAQPSFFAASVDGDTLVVFEVIASDGELTSAPDTVTIEIRDIWNETNDYPSTDTPIDIPDQDPAGITSIIHVAEDRMILKAAAEVDITHTWIGDLLITLTSPTGTVVVLHDHEGGSQSDLHETYEPAEFIGELSGGDWTLYVADTYGGDEGTLNTWTLSLDLVGDPPCATAADCDLPNVGTHLCNAGRCEIVACDAGFGDCNGLSHDGCEIETTSDPFHCGGCGIACSFDNANADCVGGSCQMGACHGNYENCNGSTGDGCEVNIGDDPLNCGACGTVCQLAHATASCAASACIVESCDALWGNCDGLPANGCEADTSSDAANCGSCGNTCSLAHAQSGCDQGACVVASCQSPWDDCDGLPANGCESDLDVSPEHCGNCGTACAYPNAEGMCASGACGMGDCDEHFMDCNADSGDGCEANIRTDTDHCGGCGQPCAYPNAQSSCVAGACWLDECLDGFGNCNHQVPDGCEIDLGSDPENCGGCGQTCELPNAETGCQDGACVVTGCEATHGDCNDDPQDGCETYLNNNPDHCGACDQGCDLPGATSTCRQGSCVLESCDPGLANCNGEIEDGCETDPATDPEHCGGCGRACSFDHATGSCQEGACTMARCDAGFGDCNSDEADGCEVDLTSDPDHCGACGNTCPEDQACTSGECRQPCTDADGDGYDDETCGGDDCNDDDPSVHPDALELCNQHDDDCDGQADEDDACAEEEPPDGCGCGGVYHPGVSRGSVPDRANPGVLAAVIGLVLVVTTSRRRRRR